MNPQAPNAKKSVLPAGNSTGQRLMIVAMIGGVLVVLLLIIMLVLSGGGDNKQNLLKVAQAQTELVRLSEMANESTDQTLKNFAINTNLTVTSDKQRFTGVLGQNGISFKDKELALGQNPETTQALETAKAAANFDATLRDTLVDQLSAYQATLKTAFDQSGNEQIKGSINQLFSNIEPLLKQSQSEAATQ